LHYIDNDYCINLKSKKNMKNITLAFAATLLGLTNLLLPDFSIAQPALQWEKSIGGSQGDYANSAVEAPGGGYVFAGTSGSNDGDIPFNLGSGDGMLFKLDVNGNLKWIKIFGGSAIDQLPFVSKTRDGGYIAIGYTDSPTIPGYHAGDDVWVVKTDSNGNLQWQKCYGGSGSDRGTGSIHQISDGNYLFCANTSSTDGDVSGYHGGGSDAWVVKIDSGGTHNVMWQKCLGGSSGGSGAKEAIEANDMGIVMAGYTFATNGDATGNHGGEDALVVKLNSTGTSVLWEECVGGAEDDDFWSIVQLANNSFAINGTSGSSTTPRNHAGSNDYWFVNLSFDGSKIIWQKCFGGSGIDNGLNAVPTSDGKFIATGRAGSSDGDETGLHGSEDFWVVKFDSNGVIWQKSLGGTAYDGGNMIIQTSDGGYVIGGETSSNDGDVTGIHGVGPSYPEDAWLVKLAPDVIAGINNTTEANMAVSVYPNPSSGLFTLQSSVISGQHSMEIYNVLGEMVYYKQLSTVNYLLSIDLSGKPSGVYLYRLISETGDIVGQGKMVIEK
jgi:hypothetical protein